LACADIRQAQAPQVTANNTLDDIFPAYLAETVAAEADQVYKARRMMAKSCFVLFLQ